MYDPVVMRRVAEVSPDGGPPGDFTWHATDNGWRYLEFLCPRGCWHMVPVAGHPQSWAWNGNEDKPTLTPSLKDMGECGWHGFITEGSLTTCGDSP